MPTGRATKEGSLGWMWRSLGSGLSQASPVREHTGTLEETRNGKWDSVSPPVTLWAWLTRRLK